MELVSVAAVSDNLVIGNDGELPWESIPEDRQQYRERIANDPVILGRVTFESMLEDLPGSAQIVLSRTEREYDIDTVYIVPTVEEAIEQARELGAETTYVIGGGIIYELFQPRLDRMLLSCVPGEYEGDTHYPEWDETEWELVAETEFEEFTLQEWHRKATAR